MMGTNYYWHDRPCEHCGRFDRIHVGKAGFTFRGYRHKLLSDDEPDWGYTYESPFGFAVVSFDDWLRVFQERPGELWDEYGYRIKGSLKWLTDITPPPPELVVNIKRWHGDPPRDGWFDERGYFFLGTEFS